MLVWIYCPLLPSIGSEVGPALARLSHGWLDPDALFGWWIGSPLVNGTLWSLGINVALMTVLHVWEHKRGLSAFDQATTVGELRPTWSARSTARSGRRIRCCA